MVTRGVACLQYSCFSSGRTNPLITERAAADRVREQSGHRTEEGVAADVVGIGVDSPERSPDPSSFLRGFADAADVGDRRADIDALDHLAAQRSVRVSQDRDIVSEVDERRRELILLVCAGRPRLAPRPEVLERVQDETDVWAHIV